MTIPQGFFTTVTQSYYGLDPEATEAEELWEEFVAIRRERLKDKNDPWFDRSVPTCKLHMPSLWSWIRVSFQDYFSWNDD